MKPEESPAARGDRRAPRARGVRLPNHAKLVSHGGAPVRVEEFSRKGLWILDQDGRPDLGEPIEVEVRIGEAPPFRARGRVTRLDEDGYTMRFSVVPAEAELWTDMLLRLTTAPGTAPEMGTGRPG